MEVEDWVKRVNGFSKLLVVDKILVLGYFLHTERQLERFQPTTINTLFDQLHMERPSNASSQMRGLTATKPKRLLLDGRGFRLAAGVREKVASWLPPVHTPKAILADLKGLEASITDPQQKVFLHEALTCFANEAYRASIVMAWNLAYHHVTSFIFDNHLDAFNVQLKTSFPKDSTAIKSFTDFEEMREGKFVAIVKTANLVSSATAKTMKAKLDIRNTAAHPSSTVIAPVTAEEVITDLVRNILLRPTL